MLRGAVFLSIAGCHIFTPPEDPSADPDGSDPGAEVDGDPDPEPPQIPFACPGGTIAPGLNQIAVGTATRRFYADFPVDMSRPLGVLFSWHGFGDDATSFRDTVGLDPDQHPDHPRVIITPQDSGTLPPVGLDWDISQGAEGDSNVDLPFFEAMLGCLNEQYTLDTSAIYSFGFSSGAVMTDLLHARYPHLLSAIISESGAWFDDPAEVELVTIPAIDWHWPALDPADGGAVLMTHGGAGDRTVLDILDLEAAAQTAIPFLRSNLRVVVDCTHDLGHALDPAVTSAVIDAFLSIHHAGTPSPLLTTALDGLPPSCTVRLP